MPALCKPQLIHKVIPRFNLRVVLTHIGKHIVNIIAKNRVGRNQMNVARTKRIAMLIQQIGNALQHNRRFAAARNAIHQKHRHIRMAHHLVLLALDGCGNVAQL